VTAVRAELAIYLAIAALVGVLMLRALLAVT
jgi:hypothetical protein